MPFLATGALVTALVVGTVLTRDQGSASEQSFGEGLAMVTSAFFLVLAVPHAVALWLSWRGRWSGVVLAAVSAAPLLYAMGWFVSRFVLGGGVSLWTLTALPPALLLVCGVAGLALMTKGVRDHRQRPL